MVKNSSGSDDQDREDYPKPSQEPPPCQSSKQAENIQDKIQGANYVLPKQWILKFTWTQSVQTGANSSGTDFAACVSTSMANLLALKDPSQEKDFLMLPCEHRQAGGTSVMGLLSTAPRSSSGE